MGGMRGALSSYFGRKVDESGIKRPVFQLGFQERAKGFSSWDYRGEGRQFPPLVNYFGRRVDGSGIKRPKLHTTGNSREN